MSHIRRAAENLRKPTRDLAVEEAHSVIQAANAVLSGSTAVTLAQRERERERERERGCVAPALTVGHEEEHVPGVGAVPRQRCGAHAHAVVPRMHQSQRGPPIRHVGGSGHAGLVDLQRQQRG